MRTAKAIAVLALAALVVGAFSAVALAGVKKKTKVIYFTGSPKINKGGKVTAKGSLNTASVSEPSRSVRLQVLDANGVVLATLDGKSTDSTGNWALSGQLPNNLPAGTNSVRVKAKKRTVGKFVCQAGVSPSVPIPAT
jgi:flagellar hook assembly protein FlgD